MNKEQKALRAAYLETEDDFSRLLDQMEVDLFEFQMYETLLNEHFNSTSENPDPLLVFMRAQENLKCHLQELTKAYERSQRLHREILAAKSSS